MATKQQQAIERRYQAERERHRQFEAMADRLRALAPKALDVLERALDQTGDPKRAEAAALAVLRATGLGDLSKPTAPSRQILELQASLGDLDDEDDE